VVADPGQQDGLFGVHRGAVEVDATAVLRRRQVGQPAALGRVVNLDVDVLPLVG
jgi:hypothetical protein